MVGTIALLPGGGEATLTVIRTLPQAMCMVVNGVNVQVGELITEILPGGDIKVTYKQSRSLVDDTYGTGTAPDWDRIHTFGNLTGSDKALFRFFDTTGAVKLEFLADYVSSAARTLYPSGYGTLGVNGGEGGMNLGSASSVVSAMTTITRTLNQSPAYYGYTVNSPLPEAAFPNWEYVDGYGVVVRGSAFGVAGFGRVEVPCSLTVLYMEFDW